MILDCLESPHNNESKRTRRAHTMDKVTLSELSHQWLSLKAKEEETRKKRTELEEVMASMVSGKDEGASHGYDGVYDVTVTRKMNRTIDKETYMQLRPLLGGIDPVKMKPSLDMKRFRSIEEADPERFKICTQFIITKPAKVAIKVEVRKDGNS